MKKFLLVILAAALLAPTAINAQDYEYVPFVRDCEFGYYYYSFGGVGNFHRFGIKNDTIIGGTDYKKFYKYTDDGIEELIVCLREQDKMVYFRQGDDESLWLDFTLDVGDDYNGIAFFDSQIWFTSLLELPEYDGDYDVVTSVDTVEFAGRNRRHISFDCAEWYEGIGIVGLSSAAPCACGIRMHYVKEGGELIYRLYTHLGWGTPIDDPYLDSGGIDGITVDKQSNGVGKVYDLSGRKVTEPQSGTIYIKDRKKFLKR